LDISNNEINAMPRSVIRIIATLMTVSFMYYMLRILDDSGAKDLLNLNAINSPKEMGKRMDVGVFLFAFVSLVSVEFVTTILYFLKFITWASDTNNPRYNIPWYFIRILLRHPPISPNLLSLVGGPTLHSSLMLQGFSACCICFILCNVEPPSHSCPRNDRKRTRNRDQSGRRGAGKDLAFGPLRALARLSFLFAR
jgi:hypothetical protein